MMNWLFILNIVFFLWVSVYKVVYLSHRLKLQAINPITIYFMANVPVIILRNLLAPALVIEWGIFNKYYQYALLITNVGLLANLLLTMFIIYICERSRFVNTTLPHWNFFTPRISGYSKTSWAFLGLAAISFIILATHSFGIVNWILDPRTGYQAHREGAGVFYDLTITSLSTAFVFHALKVYDNRIRFFAISFGYCFLSYFLGSKGFILQFFIFFIVLLWFKRVKHFNKIFIVCLGLAFSLLLYNYSTVLESLDYQAVVEYFDHYKNSAMYFEAYFNNEIDLFRGKIWATNFWGFVPRGLYPDKPYVYGVLHLNDYFFPGATELGHTPAFGGPLAPYADFGMVGVILDAVVDPKTIVGTIFTYIIFRYRDINTIRRHSVLLIIFYTQFAPVIVPFFLFPMNLFVMIFLIVGIRFLFKLRIFPNGSISPDLIPAKSTTA